MCIRDRDEGNTIPFIARYRKEAHGTLDDQVIRELSERLDYLRNLQKRKEEVGEAIAAQEAMTGELQAALDAAATLAEVEDIYRPYRPKRMTRATKAKERGLSLIHIYLQPCDSSFDSGAEACGRLMALSDPPTAIFAISDVIAAGVVQRLLRLQKIPGRDVDVFGFDNTDISRMITPTLSTIQQPGYLMGKLATELLLQKMEDLTAPSKTIFVPHELIFRETTRKAVKPEEEGT